MQHSTGPALIESLVHIGDRIPQFTLKADDGSEVSLPLPEPTLLVFFRGQW